MIRVSNEKKNLNRLAGEFLVASRLAQCGIMIALQLGNAIGYDILAFDKRGSVAYLEVKTSASHHRRWMLQSKYAYPDRDVIPLDKRFVCCVDVSKSSSPPSIHVFPALVVAKGLHYFFSSKFPQSPSYHLSLDYRPQGKTKEQVKTVGEFIESHKYVDNFASLRLDRINS